MFKSIQDQTRTTNTPFIKKLVKPPKTGLIAQNETELFDLINEVYKFDVDMFPVLKQRLLKFSDKQYNNRIKQRNIIQYKVDKIDFTDMIQQYYNFPVFLSESMKFPVEAAVMFHRLKDAILQNAKSPARSQLKFTIALLHHNFFQNWSHAQIEDTLNFLKKNNMISVPVGTLSKNRMFGKMRIMKLTDKAIRILGNADYKKIYKINKFECHLLGFKHGCALSALRNADPNWRAAINSSFKLIKEDKKRKLPYPIMLFGNMRQSYLIEQLSYLNNLKTFERPCATPKQKTIKQCSDSLRTGVIRSLENCGFIHRLQFESNDSMLSTCSVECAEYFVESVLADFESNYYQLDTNQQKEISNQFHNNLPETSVDNVVSNPQDNYNPPEKLPPVSIKNLPETAEKKLENHEKIPALYLESSLESIIESGLKSRENKKNNNKIDHQNEISESSAPSIDDVQTNDTEITLDEAKQLKADCLAERLSHDAASLARFASKPDKPSKKKVTSEILERWKNRASKVIFHNHLCVNNTPRVLELKQQLTESCVNLLNVPADDTKRENEFIEHIKFLLESLRTNDANVLALLTDPKIIETSGKFGVLQFHNLSLRKSIIENSRTGSFGDEESQCSADGTTSFSKTP